MAHDVHTADSHAGAQHVAWCTTCGWQEVHARASAAVVAAWRHLRANQLVGTAPAVAQPRAIEIDDLEDW